MNAPIEHDTVGSGGAWNLRLLGHQVHLGRTGTLAVSRVVDQGVLGLVSILLAWRLGVDGFVPVSALLVLNSLSVALSDFGLGNEVLRRDLNVLSNAAMNRVRGINAVVAVSGIGIAASLDGSTSVLVAGGVVIWGVSGETFVRKSALIRLGRVGRAAVAEMSGTAVVACALGWALVASHSATEIIAGGLIAKHLVEALVDQGWRVAFAGSGRSWEAWLWSTSVLNFAISNIDYLLVAVLVSSQAFAIYSLGYRVSALAVSQISYVVNRITLVDFGAAHRTQSLARSYQTRRRQMFRFGVIAAMVTVAAAAAVTMFLGPQWTDVLPVVVILGLAVPWRTCAPLGLNILLASGSARTVTLWEASRLGVAVIMLAVGAQFGLGWFTFAAASVVVLTANGYDRLAIRASGAPGKSVLVALGPVALMLAAFVAWRVL